MDAIEVLRPGVDLLAGMPLAGTGYLWPDAEGITSSLVLLATAAATELANHYLLLGDVDGVFWATGQGLKVLSGHDELISLRMRAHARRGDLAGVRGEGESYERQLAAGSWAAALVYLVGCVPWGSGVAGRLPCPRVADRTRALKRA